MEYKQLYRRLVDSVLEGNGESSLQLREAAFNNTGLPQPLDLLVDKVAHHAYKITDNDIDAAKNAGISEDQLFEVIICGAVGQASRQYEIGMAALAAVVKEGGGHAS